VFRRLQDSPHLLEQAYQISFRTLRPFRRWLVPGGWSERAFIEIEGISKGAIFDCRMCGQCILHHTGMTCPMTCPKNLRNGPCGGPFNGQCEVYPDRACVFVSVYERAQAAGRVDELRTYIPPRNRALQGTSSYINYFLDRDYRPEHAPKLVTIAPAPAPAEKAEKEKVAT